MMNEIWVFRPGALGDTILAFPFLEELQNQFADHNIIFWGSIEYACVLKEFFPRIEFKSFQDLQLLPLFSCDFVKADLKINLPKKIFVVLKRDKLLEKNLKLICSQVHWCEINEKDNVWVGDQIIAMLSKHESSEHSLIRKPKENAKILIHMGTGSPQKLLPPEFWNSFLHQIKKSYAVTLLFGPADKKLFFEKTDDIEIIKDVSLLELMEKMQEFGHYIGLDSGVSHLAGILGLKGYAFFHHTNPIYWHPIGRIKPITIDKNKEKSWKSLISQL